MMRIQLLLLIFFVNKSFATGLGFYEHTAKSSSLGAANYAFTSDASDALNLPAAMNSKEGRTISVSLNNYKVNTSYKFSFLKFEEGAENTIPSLFSRFKINDNFQFGFSIASRYAAQIQLPGVTLIMPNVEGSPILVSFAPSLSYKVIDNFSIGAALEYAYLDYSISVTSCRFCVFKNNEVNNEGNTQGLIPSLSIYYNPINNLHLGFNYRAKTKIDNEDISAIVPESFNFFSSYIVNNNFTLHFNYTRTIWNEAGVVFTDYQDHFGLFKASRDSDRFAFASEFNYEEFNINLAYSMDEAVDKLGGNDKRYRLGFGYQFSDKLFTNISYVHEDYARKEEGNGQVVIENEGHSAMLSVTSNY